MRILLLLLFPAILLSSCLGRKARMHPEEYLNKTAFPEDLKKDGYVLLIHKQETSKMVSNIQNNRVDKLMKKNYDKPYEMVSSADLQSNSKYANKNIYRYLLKQTEPKGSQSISGAPGTGSTTFVYRDVYITDRLTEKRYPNAGQSLSSFEACMQIVSAYLGRMK